MAVTFPPIDENKIPLCPLCKRGATGDFSMGDTAALSRRGGIVRNDEKEL